MWSLKQCGCRHGHCNAGLEPHDRRKLTAAPLLGAIYHCMVRSSAICDPFRPAPPDGGPSRAPRPGRGKSLRRHRSRVPCLSTPLRPGAKDRRLPLGVIAFGALQTIMERCCESGNSWAAARFDALHGRMHSCRLLRSQCATRYGSQ